VKSRDHAGCNVDDQGQPRSTDWFALETILGRRVAKAEKAILLAGGVEVGHPPSIPENGDPASLQLERRVRSSSLRRRAEATLGQHDDAEKDDSPTAAWALPRWWAAKGRREFCFRATRPEGCVGGAPYIVIIHNVHKSRFV
jgi:hypothetical protein